MRLTIHLLGSPRIERDGAALPSPRGHKIWALLAYLLLSRVPVGRPHLAALLFADAQDPLGALRWNLSQLRKLLGDSRISGDKLTLGLEPGAWVDLWALSEGPALEAVDVPGIGRDLLEGISFPSSPAFDIWLASERMRLHGLGRAVLREAALQHLAGGAPGSAVQLAGRLVALEPLDENFQALLVRSLAASGDAEAAERQVQACRDLFNRQLGTVPGPALEASLRAATAAPLAPRISSRAAALAHLESGQAAVTAGALPAGLEQLRRAVAEADAYGDRALRARTRVALGGALVHSARGHDEEGAPLLHEALALAEQASPSDAAAACRELAYIEFLRARYDRALVWLDRADPLAAQDPAERLRISSLRGCVLSDTAHYSEALAQLCQALDGARDLGDERQAAYLQCVIGRILLLREDLGGAAQELEASEGAARRLWTALLPWPQAMLAEVDLLEGRVARAADRLQQAFALGCQLGDPCWEGIAGRGLGRVAELEGDLDRSVGILVDAVGRSVRLADGYLWGKAYALDSLCGVAVKAQRPEAAKWIDELQELAGLHGMREMSVRSQLHRARLGDDVGTMAARQLALQIDNPSLHRLARS